MDLGWVGITQECLEDVRESKVFRWTKGGVQK